MTISPRQRAKLAMEHELAKLRERQDALYHDDLDEMNFDHLTARLEREGDEARPALDLAQLRTELAGKAEQAVRYCPNGVLRIEELDDDGGPSAGR